MKKLKNYYQKINESLSKYYYQIINLFITMHVFAVLFIIISLLERFLKIF